MTQDFLQVTGIVLKSIPVGEYDRAVTILTKEKGKISAFARNARKQNNRFMAAVSPFCFGKFKLYAGRNSYTMAEAEIDNYFEELRSNLENIYYGMYFLEVADYYTRENNAEAEMLKLLYQSLRALLHKNLDNRLVRAVYECKAMAVNGEFPGVPGDRELSESAAYTLQFIAVTPVERLYTFTVTESVLLELQEVAAKYREKIWGHSFKSLEMLEGWNNEYQ
ncbi:MAG: DNA repair protein RecO [Lachnospiraceae bacterium]|nr:DNA repair protein RecO [Lachnospiraceae bacterium]